MNLRTHYLGLSLRNPFVVGASPYCDNLTLCRELVDAGASALVMHSFFEEQIGAKPRDLDDEVDDVPELANAGSVNWPVYEDYRLDSEQYLRQLERLRGLVDVPVIASLNGSSVGNWVGQAQRMEDAGASALELNLYHVAADPSRPGHEVEADMLELVQAVAAAVKIPLAVKLSPYHSALAHFAARLAENGAAGLVLFNRFYQADVNLDTLEPVPRIVLSTSADLLLRLRWLSIIGPQFPGQLACSGGIHNAGDAVKALLAGADVLQVVSVLLKKGPREMTRLIEGLEQWMQSSGLDSLDKVRGKLNLRRSIDPSGHERADYLRVLQAWRS